MSQKIDSSIQVTLYWREKSEYCFFVRFRFDEKELSIGRLSKLDWVGTCFVEGRSRYILLHGLYKVTGEIKKATTNGPPFSQY